MDDSLHIRRKHSAEPSSGIRLTMPSFLTQLHGKLEKSIKSHLKASMKNDGGVKSATSIPEKDRRSSTALEADLEKQLQAWKVNPSWVDQSPAIKVTVPKGSLCNLNVKVNVGLPPDAVYNIVTDPDNKRVFKNIKEVLSRRVLVNEGHRQVVEVEQAALWRFLWWSGTISVHVLVDQNREDHTMKFKQVKSGFMKRFEGCWKVEPLLADEKLCHPILPKTLEEYVACTGGKGRLGSKVSLEQIIQPSFVPPPPISWYLRGITIKTTEMLINDLLAEAARIRADSDQNTGESGTLQRSSDECQLARTLDIKRRWGLHRRNARRLQRRSPLLVNH